MSDRSYRRPPANGSIHMLFLNPKRGLALCGGLLTVLLLARLLVHVRSEKGLDTRGGTLADFVEWLQERGVRLHVVWGARNTGAFEHVYLTEDPAATWVSLETRPRIVECIHRWRGTVWVGRPLPAEEVANWLAQAGPYGCRIGNFVLFGDERILGRIQEVCRSQSDW